MNQLMLGVDLGTSGSKAVLLERTGDILATAKSEYGLSRPHEGWSEQNPDDWWKGVRGSIRKVLETSGVEPARVKALALSGQMHGSVFLDSSGEVIRPPILWNDTRTSDQCEEMKEEIGEDKLRDLVGNPVLEGFTAPKLLWLRENEPENYRRVDTLLLPKDFVVYRLTGNKSTEVSDAAGTVLFNVEKKKWEPEILEKLDIDEEILPEVRESTDVVGRVTEEASNQLGLDPETLVIAGGADNACSAVGNGIVEEGRLLASIGSSGVVLAHTDSMHVDKMGRLHSFNHAQPNSWYLMGVMLAAGLSFRWFRRCLGGMEESISEQLDSDPYDLLTKEAETAPPGSGKLIFLPYLGGERTPHADPDARGVFFGLTDSHKKGHLVRAVLEGISFGLRDSLELIKEKEIEPREIRITGGGANSDLWTQIQADIFGYKIKKTSINEGPAFGAALLAGVGAGIYRDVNQATSETIEARTVAEPRRDREQFYNELYGVYRSLYGSLKDDFKSLADIEESFR